MLPIELAELNEDADDLFAEASLGEAAWSASKVNGFPDSSFAVIMPGGTKDADGRTTPRSLRKLPYKDAGGAIDLPHLRNALARLPQMKGVSADLKAKAKATLEKSAKANLPTHQGESDMPPDSPTADPTATPVAPVVDTAPAAPKLATTPTADSLRVEMLPINKFDPITLELVDVDPKQGIQALVGNLNKYADGDAKVVQTYVFTGDFWADASANKWIKTKGAKKGEDWQSKPADAVPAPKDTPPADAQPVTTAASADGAEDRHYGQPRKRARTLAEMKVLGKKIDALRREVSGLAEADAPATLLPGEQPAATAADTLTVLQDLFDEFLASVAETLGLPVPADATDASTPADKTAADKTPPDKTNMSMAAEAMDGVSTDSLLDAVRGAFRAAFCQQANPDKYEPKPWPMEVFLDEGYLIAEFEGTLYRVDYTEKDGDYQFTPEPQWKKVMRTYVVAESAHIRESFEGALAHVQLEDAALAEADTPGAAAKPLSLLVEIIQPGWGNTADNHYYPADMLATCADKFVGKKMYETNHRESEKSTRTWVSTIAEMKGLSTSGAPIARVVVHDPGFAERVRNLNTAGLLDKMECSILADGKATPGFEENGRKGKKVEAITSVESVDWVTAAGAGGHVAALAESGKGGPTLSPKLTAEAVKQLVEASKLPAASQVRLTEQQYGDEATLKAAIVKERDYVKVLTGSGQPFGNAAGAVDAPLSEADRIKAQDALLERTFGK
jgi:hypothetical protein